MTNAKFTPHCLPILIGSLPVDNHLDAVNLILEYTPEIPLWPQLPTNPKEGMVRQFLSGFPGLTEEEGRFWIDTAPDSFTEEMTHFYEDEMEAEANEVFLANSRFALTRETAEGFLTFIDTIKTSESTQTGLKGQVTGPVTTGIGVVDQNGRNIFYDDNLRDMMVKHLSLKAKWQVHQLIKFKTAVPPIIFFDEPGIVSFGSSAYIGISREMVHSVLTEVMGGVQRAGGIPGVHICANGDWSLALELDFDIISFDAYFYFDNFILYKDQLQKYIRRGGLLAWGIVPTSDPEAVAKESTESLYEKWLKQLNTLSKLGFPETQLINQTLIAPACGTGSLPLDLAIKVLTMTRDLSAKIRAI